MWLGDCPHSSDDARLAAITGPNVSDTQSIAGIWGSGRANSADNDDGAAVEPSQGHFFFFHKHIVSLLLNKLSRIQLFLGS